MDTDLTLISKKKQGDDQKYSTPYTLLDLDYDTEDIVEIKRIDSRRVFRN